MTHREDELTPRLDMDTDTTGGLAMCDLYWVISDGFGERCPDYAPGCSNCRAWRAYDDLAYLLDFVHPNDVSAKETKDA